MVRVLLVTLQDLVFEDLGQGLEVQVLLDV